MVSSRRAFALAVATLVLAACPASTGGGNPDSGTPDSGPPPVGLSACGLTSSTWAALPAFPSVSVNDALLRISGAQVQVFANVNLPMGGVNKKHTVYQAECGATWTGVDVTLDAGAGESFADEATHPSGRPLLLTTDVSYAFRLFTPNSDGQTWAPLALDAAQFDAGGNVTNLFAGP